MCSFTDTKKFSGRIFFIKYQQFNPDDNLGDTVRWIESSTEYDCFIFNVNPESETPTLLNSCLQTKCPKPLFGSTNGAGRTQESALLGLLVYYEEYRGTSQEEMDKGRYRGVEAKFPCPLCEHHSASHVQHPGRSPNLGVCFDRAVSQVHIFFSLCPFLHRGR